MNMVKVVFKNNENKEIDLTKETEKVVRKTIKLVGLILKKAGDKLEDITKGEQQLSLIFFCCFFFLLSVTPQEHL